MVFWMIYSNYLNPSLNHSITTMHENVGIKCSVINEKSPILWHKRLGHVSIEKIKRLVNDRVLEALDFTDFGIYVDYNKGKHTNKAKKKSAKRISNV